MKPLSKLVLLAALGFGWALPALGQNECGLNGVPVRGTNGNDAFGINHQNLCVDLTTGNIYWARAIQGSASIGTIITGGGTPNIDITAAPYSALCDGVTDITAALLAAIDFLNSAGAGGTIMFPRNKTCVVAGQISRDNLTSIKFTTYTEGAWASNQGSHTTLKFSTSATPALQLRNCFGCKIDGLIIQCTNASMTGVCISLDSVAGGNGQSNQTEISNTTINGDSVTPHTGTCLSISGAIQITLRKDSIDLCVDGLRGSTGGAQIAAVNVKLDNVEFANSGRCSISGAYLRNPGVNWNVDTSDFEIGTCSPLVPIIDINGGYSGSVNVTFNSSFIGDQGAGNPTGTLLKIPGCNSCAVQIHGGQFTPGSTNAVMVSLGSGASLGMDGVLVSGAVAQTFVTLAGQNTLNIAPNIVGTVTIANFKTGSNPLSAILYDFTVSPPALQLWANTTEFLAIPGSNVFIGTAGQNLIYTPPIDFLEATTPSGIAAFAVCYADSTAHALECSYNNGTFGVVPLLNRTETFTAPQSMTTFNSATNCAVNSASPAACGSAPTGVFAVPTTTTTYTVNTTAVTANSRIFIQDITDNTGIPSAPTCTALATFGDGQVSARVAGTSFTISLPSTAGTTCFNYWIVN